MIFDYVPILGPNLNHFITASYTYITLVQVPHRIIQNPTTTLFFFLSLLLITFPFPPFFSLPNKTHSLFFQFKKSKTMSLDPPPTTATTSRPTTPFTNPNSKPIHYSQQPQPQQQQALHVRSPNPFLYPFASPSRASANHAVGGYPPPPPPSQPQPPLLYSHGGGVRGMNLDYLSHALHVTRPLSHVQFPHLAATASPPVKGHLKVLKFDFWFWSFFF